MWTLHRLVELWTAVILRAPRSLTQALQAALAGSGGQMPGVPATPQAFFARFQTLRWTFFRGVFEAFTERLVPTCKAVFAGAHGPALARFSGVWVVDGSHLDKIAHRLKILWRERDVVLPGCLLALYGLERGVVRRLGFDPDAAAGEWPRAKAMLDHVPEGVLLLGDRLYATGQFFAECTARGLLGLVRRKYDLGIEVRQILRRCRRDGGLLQDRLVLAGSGPAARTLRWIRWQRGRKVVELLTNVLDPRRLGAEEAIALYRSRWTVERLFHSLKCVLNLDCFHAANPNAVAMQVYAAAIVYNAMRFVQGEVAAREETPPEEISEARLFPRVAVASHLAAGAEIGIRAVLDLNPRARLKRPDLHSLPFACADLDDLLVQPRRGRRRMRRPSNVRAQWKSLKHVPGALD